MLNLQDKPEADIQDDSISRFFSALGQRLIKWVEHPNTGSVEHLRIYRS
jgi:hypothetical protein